MHLKKFLLQVIVKFSIKTFVNKSKGDALKIISKNKRMNVLLLCSDIGYSSKFPYLSHMMYKHSNIDSGEKFQETPNSQQIFPASAKNT